MATKYGKKIFKQKSIIHTLITAVALSLIFLVMVGYLYNKAEDEAYENLHLQTQQIKDNLVMQIKSDNENLFTMANFAAKLNAGGMDYRLMFDSFKPIGLFSRIGILTPDCTFITKDETFDLKDRISFEKEASLGAHITGRTYSYSSPDEEVIRSGVPIDVNGKTVGIIYGTIKTDTLGERYKQMVDDLDAQLFIYEKETGNIIVDTVHDNLGNILFLKDRRYIDGYSYEQFRSTDKGFTAFQSAYKNETLYLHYSAIEDFGWMIAMGRYDPQVFKSAHERAIVFALVFAFMLFVIAMYVLILVANERKINAISECASSVRKELLETTDGQNNIQDALIEICKFAKSKCAIFFDTDGEFYSYTVPKYKGREFSKEESKYFNAELFRYAVKFHDKNKRTVNVMCIKPDKHMLNTNPDFFTLLKKYDIKEISLSATINNSNYITVLAAINSIRGNLVRMLAEKVSACFSMALYNKNNLNRTILAATTDSLTGALNRVAYKQDIVTFDEQQAGDFSCIYIDVNELHLCNNKYGHAAGDNMLLFIANTLKEVFYGHKVYRMGGDEFLVFCQNTDRNTIDKNIKFFEKQLETNDYHVAIGISFKAQNSTVEDMVREAEVMMYEAKAMYYQNKEHHGDTASKGGEYVQTKTGIVEIDAILSVLKEKYNGIYRVSLSTDKAKHILMPAYLNYNEEEDHFSKLFSKFVAEMVEPDYHRSVLSFLNYEALNNQLMNGTTPEITFKKNNGEYTKLSVYKLDGSEESVFDTLWVFAKAEL